MKYKKSIVKVVCDTLIRDNLSKAFNEINVFHPFPSQEVDFQILEIIASYNIKYCYLLHSTDCSIALKATYLKCLSRMK